MLKYLVEIKLKFMLISKIGRFFPFKNAVSLQSIVLNILFNYMHRQSNLGEMLIVNCGANLFI